LNSGMAILKSTRACRISENRNIEIGTHTFQIKTKGGRSDG